MKDEKSYEQNFKQPKRWSAQRKVDAVMRLFRGEDLDSVSRDLGIESYRLNEWREAIKAFVENYNEHWLLEKLGYRSPRETRRLRERKTDAA